MKKMQNYPPRGMERFIRYKWVKQGGESPYLGCEWPVIGLAAKWETAIKGDLEVCGNGYHTCKHNPFNVWEWHDHILWGRASLIIILLKLEVADVLPCFGDKQVWRYTRVLENLGSLTRKQVRALDFSGR